MMKDGKSLKKVTVILLAAVMILECMPFLGGTAYAADADEIDEKAYYSLADKDGGFVAADEALTKSELDAALAGEVTDGNEQLLDEPLLTEEDPAEEKHDPEKSKATVTPSVVTDPDDVEALKEKIQESGFIDTGCDISLKNGIKLSDENTYAEIESGLSVDSSGIASFYAIILTEGVTFRSMYVDDTEISDDYDDDKHIDGLTQIGGSFDMKDFQVGYHTVYFVLNGAYNYPGWTKVPTDIYKKPSIRLKDFYTGYNYFNYSDNYNSYDYDENCKIYLDYKKGSGSWKKKIGYVSTGGSGKKTGLTPAKKYSFRAYYGIETYYDYDGQQYFFSGPVSKTVKAKTGYKKTPIKSITAKGKQFCKKYRVRKLSKKLYYRYGYAGWGYYRKILGYKTIRYWYTRVTITVRMKKKPGIAGIYIGQYKRGGNKKVYKKKVTFSGKKKGKKLKVGVQSYMSKTYGGWSKSTKKKIKIR
ncbi:MAG: hypothetical protein IJH41_03115 [Eubacterium sp.]|nr:hypothetical protein [Eubacterium sp.]